MNWNTEAKKYEAQFKKDLKELVAIPSLRDESTAKENAPFGEQCRKALDKMMEIGHEAGFTVKNIDGYACTIEYGEGKESVGILAHLDIVPIGEDWTHDPLGCEEVDGIMYGRGTLDDKGPAVAGLTAMRMLKDNNVKLNKKIMLICGCDEESGMQCMDYYCKHAEVPTMSFTPDAEFPVIYGEKGLLQIALKGHAETPILSMHCGERPNVVIGKASALVKDFREEYVDLFDFYLRSNNLQGSVEYTEAGCVLKIDGVFAHASLPWRGTNAALHLINFIGTTYENEFLTNTYRMLSDWRGSGVSIAKEGAYMGFLTANVGIVDLENDEFNIVIDMRYPNDTDSETIIKGYQETFKTYDYPAEIMVRSDSKPLFLDPNSEMIQKLMSVYREYSGDTFTPAMTMGGGTYARKLPNCVAFGPEYPIARHQSEHVIGGPHQADEGIVIDDMLCAVAIYAGALEKLGQ